MDIKVSVPCKEPQSWSILHRARERRNCGRLESYSAGMVEILNLRVLIVGRLIVQNHIEQRLMDSDAAVVFDKAKLAKPVHEKTDSGTSGADHLRQRLLRDFRKRRFRATRLAKFRHQQENPR
jgi:hypothetical protein